MLTRQKALLLLIQQAGRPVSESDVMDWAFLLREEMPSGGGMSFYQFLPHENAPCSFCLRHEVATLVRDEYLESRDDGTWTPVRGSARIAQDLPAAIQRDCERLVQRIRSNSAASISDYISERYSSFLVDADDDVLDCQRANTLAVYTSGYEGTSVDGLLHGLISHGIGQIIDVRRNPVARRFGFHKSTLAHLAGCVGISYVHFPELGISSSLRQHLASADDYEALLNRYERTTLREQGRAVRQVADILVEQPSVLLCMEADPSKCHRTRLAKMLAPLVDLPIVDITRKIA